MITCLDLEPYAPCASRCVLQRLGSGNGILLVPYSSFVLPGSRPDSWFWARYRFDTKMIRLLDLGMPVVPGDVHLAKTLLLGYKVWPAGERGLVIFPAGTVGPSRHHFR